MLQGLGEVVEEHNGNTKFTLNGHTLVVHQTSPSSMVEPASLMKLRHFLQHSSGGESGAGPAEDHLLVVIDHHEARVFKSDMHGTEPTKIVPFDPHGYGRHVHNAHEPVEGRHQTPPKSFFEAVAKSISGASHILIFGNGAGGTSAMSEFMDYLHENEKVLFEHVMGAVPVDETHLTENELLAKARDFYGPASADLAQSK